MVIDLGIRLSLGAILTFILNWITFSQQVDNTFHTVSLVNVW